MNLSMQPADNVVAAIFEAALACKTKEERTAYLDKVCASQPGLRQRVEALLAAHELADSFLEPPSNANPTVRVEFPGDEGPGDVIGLYKIREKIGEGGCGVVYVADQDQPVRRRVALKVVKLGMDTKQVVARFEAERQALALMDHPNIAKVLDAGATATGRPFFVMELVRGIKITEYCDQNNLSTEDRLKLFIQVCQAVQHAHQKGIIHRDIKPSNVLVTLHDGVPVPKVIDFGIAKATGDQRLTDKTIYTAFEQFLGTPAYMSPEQAEMSGLDIDTRSDIYSLGVLLYELLTGRTPFDPKTLMQAGIDQMRRIIREQEPPRPSTRLSTLAHADLTTVAKQRHAEAPRLVTLIRGDLDWIVMKCLEKDRTRRYDTATGLGLDIQRHLNNEAVVARPPSATYRLMKLASRNKLAFAAGIAVLSALLAGLAIALVFYTREVSARKQQAELTVRASESAERAHKVLADIFQITEAAGTPRRVQIAKRREFKLMLADSGVDNYQVFLRQSPNDPSIKADLARLYQQQVRIYQQQLNLDAAELATLSGTEREELSAKMNERHAIVTNALQTSRAMLGELVASHPKESSYRDALAVSYSLLAEFEFGPASAPALNEALKLRRELVKELPDDPNQQEAIANLYQQMAAVTTNRNERLQFAQAELQFRKVLTQRHGTDSATVSNAFYKLAAAYGSIATLHTNPLSAASYLSNAINTINADWNAFLIAGVDTNAPGVDAGKISALIQYQSGLARRLYQAGNIKDASYWAKASADTAGQIAGTDERYTEGQMLDALVEYGDMLQTAGRDTEAEAAYGRVEKILRGMARSPGRYYFTRSMPSGPFQNRDAVLELDKLWEKQFDRALGAGNFAGAAQISGSAEDFWRQQYQDNKDAWAWTLSASLRRKAELAQVVGRDDIVATAMEESSHVESAAAQQRPENALQLAKLLAQRTIIAESIGEGAKILGSNYYQQTISTLSQIVIRSNLAYSEVELASPEMSGLRQRPEFASLEKTWRTQSESQRAIIAAAVEASDIESIRFAQVNRREIKLRGKVARAFWSNNRKTFFIHFVGVDGKAFKAVIRESELAPVAGKLQGVVEEIIKPGGTLELKGTPMLFAGFELQMLVNRGEQIVSYTPPGMSDVSSTSNINIEKVNSAVRTNLGEALASAVPLGAISVGDSETLRQRTNQNVVLVGTVRIVRNASQDESLVILFRDANDADEIRPFVPNEKAAAFAAALGGDPKEILAGKRIELHGRLTVRRGFLNMVLNHPGQIYIDGKQVGLAPVGTNVFTTSNGTLSAADADGLSAALGREATVEGIVSSAVWSKSKAVFLIEFGTPGFMAASFQARATNILHSLGDESGTQFAGKRVQVKGTVAVYTGKDPKYADWMQIIVNRPDQIKIMK